MDNVILNVAESDKYSGLYVAMTDFENGKIVGSGPDPEKASLEANARGCQDPVLVYVPEKDAIYIY